MEAPKLVPFGIYMDRRRANQRSRVELWTCYGHARCGKCGAKASAIAHYVDADEGPLHRAEYCERHAAELPSRGFRVVRSARREPVTDQTLS
jgi:hypothetical protein